jgi:ATP-dependent DNA ligase
VGRRYRLRVTKITTKPPFPELRGKLSAVRWPALSEIKYDGEYNIIVYTDEKDVVTCTAINKYGKARTHFPAIDTIAAECRANDVSEAVFLAELYTDEGKMGALYDLLGRKEDNNLKVSVFDASRIRFKSEYAQEFEDINVQHPLIQRLETYMHILPSQRTQLKIVMNKDEAEAHFKEITTQGYEGTVVKPLDSPLVMGPCPWVKMKYKDQSDYEVAEIDPVKERIEVLVPNPNEPDPMMSAVNVGVKVMNADKATLNVGDLVTIEHQGVLDSGSLRHPVFKGKV